jgi:hypothetical protein
MNKSLSLVSLVGMIAIAVVTTAGACNSGIQGTVTLGPTCPVERPGMTCYKPYAGTIDIFNESDRLVKTVHSSADGKLRVSLKPGTYTLKPQPRDPARPYPIGKPVSVTVKPGSYTSVNIEYDTGIR